MDIRIDQANNILKSFGVDTELGLHKSLQYNNDIEFNKTGSEIREKCLQISNTISTEIVNLKDKISTLRSEIKEELGIEPTEKYYGNCPSGIDLYYSMVFQGSNSCESPNGSSTETNKKVSDYNNSVYQLMDKAGLLESVVAIQNNIKDNKEYKLSLQTIQDLKF